MCRHRFMPKVAAKRMCKLINEIHLENHKKFLIIIHFYKQKLVRCKTWWWQCGRWFMAHSEYNLWFDRFRGHAPWRTRMVKYDQRTRYHRSLHDSSHENGCSWTVFEEISREGNKSTTKCETDIRWKWFLYDAKAESGSKTTKNQWNYRNLVRGLCFV